MTPNRPLQLTVFGATGKIGRHVIDQLLAAGHTVTAYARDPSKLPTTQPNLTVIQGGPAPAAPPRPTGPPPPRSPSAFPSAATTSSATCSPRPSWPTGQPAPPGTPPSSSPGSAG